jgi:hypothetical protein
MRGRRKIELDDSQIEEIAERHNRHESTRKIAVAMNLSQWIVWVTLNDLKSAPEPVVSENPMNRANTNTDGISGRR